ncbi:unnamed protein product [Ascophyllum nodosum]
MADPGGQPPQAGERKGISLPYRLLLMALVFLFVRRYIGDGSAPQAPASPAKGAPTNEDVQLPDTPLEKDVPSVKDKVQIGVPGFTDEEDEFAGLGRKTGVIQTDAEVLQTAAGVLPDKRMPYKSSLPEGLGPVPRVLVQYCSS